MGASLPGNTADRWARETLAGLEARHLRRHLEPLETPQGPRVRVGGAELTNFASNDYLGLAADPALKAVAAEAVARWGVGSGASRLVVGELPPHAELEDALARFEGTEAALVFSSGYAANAGTIGALVGPGDAVFSDERNHASLVDGCRLSRARVVVYRHGDPDHLGTLLAATAGRRKLVVTDGVFSMDGDLAPLRELGARCEAAGAALLVDEAHATGVLGARGTGACEALEARADVRVGTLSKALGTSGAWVGGSSAVKALLLNRARSFVYSTGLPPAACVTAMAAVARVASDPAPRERLWRNVRHLAAGLTALGWEAPGRSAIFSLPLGTPERALAAAASLRRQGLLVKAIRPPTVPEGTSRLRVAVSAGHTLPELDALLAALRALPR
jgi:8-amino-7-oxononanoate synthase